MAPSLIRLSLSVMLFRLAWFLVRFALLPLWLPLRALRRRFPSGGWLHITIDGAVVDFAPPPRFFRLGPEPTSIHGLERMAKLAAGDPRVRGVLFTLRGMRAGMATATALREVIGRLERAGKETAVHLPLGGETKELYVASAARRIFVGPQTTIAPLGFASRTRYVKHALEKAGVEADVLAQGAYKSFGETLVRDGMSEPQREQVNRLLDGFYEEVVRALAAGRRVDEARARAWIDGAPFRGTAAVEAGLVDGACYEDELPTLIGGERPPWFVDASSYVARMTATALPQLRRRAGVGIVAVHGTISGGASERIAMDERVIQAVRLARADRRVRAVILHVNSPGGSALASDRMHHELVQLAKDKPLIACFSDVAASGGYYVAAAAEHVVAQPTTITGSIGVVSARFSIEPLLDRLGVRTETLQRGARAGLLDPLKPLTEDERRALDVEMGGIYDAFVGVVAAGRKRDRAEIERVAGGRVWNGRDAKDVGLVDELGGLSSAVAFAQRRASLAEDAPLVIVRGAPWGRLPPLPLPKRAARGAAALAEGVADLLGLDLELVGLFRGERVLLLSEIARRLT
jgi:protease-4